MDAAILFFGLSLHHPEALGQHEALNPGLGLAVQEENARGVVGYYHNSEGRDSFFFGGGGDFPLTPRLSVMLHAVLVSGYEPLPIIAPVASLAYDFDPITIHAAALPGAVAFFAEYRL